MISGRMVSPASLGESGRIRVNKSDGVRERPAKEKETWPFHERRDCARAIREHVEESTMYSGSEA